MIALLLHSRLAKRVGSADRARGADQTCSMAVWLHFLPWPDQWHSRPRREQLAHVGFSLPQRIFLVLHWSHTISQIYVS